MKGTILYIVTRCRYFSCKAVNINVFTLAAFDICPSVILHTKDGVVGKPDLGCRRFRIGGCRIMCEENRRVSAVLLCNLFSKINCILWWAKLDAFVLVPTGKKRHSILFFPGNNFCNGIRQHISIDDHTSHALRSFLQGFCRQVPHVGYGSSAEFLLHFQAIFFCQFQGGFIYRDENVEEAASRILQERTQLSGIFLQQFHLFGDVKRTEQKHARALLEANGIEDIDSHWLVQRFVTVGYYALVEYEKVTPVPDDFSSECAWQNVMELRNLIIDHKQIIEKGLQSLRVHLNYQPIGYNLLPREFPLKDLQLIYETILGKKLDRSNFQRKILSYGILERKEKQFNGGSHRAPYLYAFDKAKYFKALKEGLNKDW